MTELEQAREHKSALYQRLKGARASLLDTADPGVRRREQERVRILKQMYQEACANLRRLEGGNPARVEKTQSRNTDVTLNCGAVWADLEGVTWRQVEGRSWNDLPRAANGRQMKLVQELVRTAMGMCTEMQLRYLNAYYTEGLTLEEIGERFGVDTSTVSRTLKRGRARIEQYVTAKLLLSRCVDERGKFDYMKFLNSARILTERQKEMVYLILAKDTSYRDIAAFVERSASTVSRTVDRVEEKLGALAVQVDTHWSAITVERASWSGRSEKQLAEDLGLSPAFYYRVVRRGERIDGLPLLYCAILHRLAAGQSVEQTAKGLGCSAVLVKRVRRYYGALPLPDFAEDYHPRPVRKERVPENPFAALGGDAVMDRIDAATYQELQCRFGRCGGGDTRGPRKTERFCGERTSPGTSETSRLRGGEGCGGGEDAANT